MRVFVAGATGVIGRRAVPLLIAAGHQVTAAGRSPDRLEALRRAGASVLALDLLDREAIARAVPGHDAVVNLATCIPSGMRAFLPGAWAENHRIRTHGSAALADAALTSGARVLVQESFVTYPDSGDRWITEETPPRPERYNRTVLDAEASAWRFAESGGRGVILRFAFFYGPGDRFTRDVLAGVRRGWLPIPGRPDGFFPMVTHADAAAAVAAALEAPSGAYNVADDRPPTRRELGELLAALVGVPPPRLPPAWTVRLAGSVGRMVARSLRVSNARLKQATGWTPRYPGAREGWAAALAALGGSG